MTAAADKAAERLRRFRARRRRLDYVPGPDALKLLDEWARANPGLSWSAILDYLIIAGNATMRPGNGVGPSRA